MSGHVSVGELIDLNSPVSWNTKPKVFTPLIPVPANQSTIPFSPVDTNPFDFVAAQTDILSSQDDPFELIFSTATSTIKNDGISPKIDVEEPKSNEIIKNKNESDDPFELVFNGASSTKKNDCFLSKMDIVKEPKSNEIIRSKNESNFDCVSKQWSSPLLRNTGDLDSYLLNKCDEINKPFGTDIISPAQICSSNFVLAKNKPSTESITTQFTSDVDSVGSLNKARVYSTISSMQQTSDDSKDGDFNDSVFTQGELNFNDIAKEAEKISRLLSESSSKFSQSGFPGDIEDDIMSCEPSWVCDSSEDEVDSLRKDPALNLRISYSSMSDSFLGIKKSLEDSDAVKRFKSIKKRRSLGIQTNDDDLIDDIQNDEKSLRRSQSLGSRLQEYNPPSGIIAVKQLPVALVKPEENISSKLKSKKPILTLERKPLKALIPLQNMARNYLQTKGKAISSFRDISPTQKHNLLQPRKQGTPPVKRISSGSPKPVASSTPTSTWKRHSFGSSKPEGTHKSRSQFTHFGSAARRSSSANSGIPTPISLR